MAVKTQTDKVLEAIGSMISDTPEAWAHIAMHCLDQGGVACGVQDEVSAILLRAGIEADAERR